jgi:hypothetical protein
MDKFQKRITKNIRKSPNDCLVVGNAFGYFDSLLNMFNTVFVYETDITTKAKNLITRKNIESTFDLRDVSAIFIDLDKLNIMDQLSPLITRAEPDIFIEGDEVIPRTQSSLLYQVGYNAVAKLGWCHQWSRRI